MKILTQQPKISRSCSPVTTYTEFEQAIFSRRLCRLYLLPEDGVSRCTDFSGVGAGPVTFTENRRYPGQTYNVYKCTSGTYAGHIVEIKSELDLKKESTTHIRVHFRILRLLGRETSSNKNSTVVARTSLELLHKEVRLGNIMSIHHSLIDKRFTQQEKLKNAYSFAKSSENVFEYRFKLGLFLDHSRLKNLPEPLYYSRSDGSLISTQDLVELVENASVEEAYKALSK